MNLSESEQKYLLRFEKSVKKIYWNYISIGVSLCTAIVALIVGIQFNRKEVFLATIIFTGFAVILFLLSRTYQKLYTIIEKMKQTIEELESRK